MTNGPVNAHPPVFQFDATQPIVRGDRRDFTDVDDPALTAFVMTLCDELYSLDTHPVPPCPQCTGVHVRFYSRRNNAHLPLPIFQCNACKRFFTRLSGSPLANLRVPGRIPDFVRLLSQAIPIEEASRRLNSDNGTVSSWLMRFRQLVELHDPDGQWITRVKLGLRYRLQGTCVHCGYDGQMKSAGFDGARRKRVQCPECGHLWTINREDAGTQIGVGIAHDPALTAVRRRRRQGFAAPDLTPAAHGVLVIPAKPQVPAIRLPDAPAPLAQRFDFTQPLSSKRTLLPRQHTEDTELTEYLRMEIARIFSPEIEPVPVCPHCHSGDTRFTRRHPKPPCLPEFQCDNCTRRFTRPTGTPMVKIQRKDVVMELLPLLSQHRHVAHVAEQFNVTANTITGWVKQFRAWLLKLEPTGHYEQLVRLGLKSAWPVLVCPKCHQEAPAKPQGFLQRKSIPFGQVRLFRCSACQHYFRVPVDELPGAKSTNK